MAEEEAAVAAVNTATEKGKEQIDEISEEGDFNFQDLLGQELTDAEKEELKKYATSCGYKSGAMLFGGVNEGKLRCLKLLEPSPKALACRSWKRTCAAINDNTSLEACCMLTSR